jgi:hypothetical protein
MPTQDAGKGRQANGYGKETHEYDLNGKDALARIWDTVFGDRHAGTNETQDRAHSAIVFLVTLALITGIASLGAWLWHDHASYREDHILVPAATYADDQTESVEGQLKDMGFVDIATGDAGITAYGTKSMCDTWRSSFWDRNVADAVASMSDTAATTSANHMASGIVRMSHDDDWKTVTITTLTSSPSVSVIGYMLESDDVASAAIDAAANWCAILHDGRRLHVSFVEQDGSEYLSIDTDTTRDIIAQLQGKEDNGGKGSTKGDANAAVSTGGNAKDGT